MAKTLGFLKQEVSMKVPYKLVKCKVRGCTIQHDAYYPMCTKHRREQSQGKGSVKSTTYRSFVRV